MTSCCDGSNGDGDHAVQHAASVCIQICSHHHQQVDEEVTGRVLPLVLVVLLVIVADTILL